MVERGVDQPLGGGPRQPGASHDVLDGLLQPGVGDDRVLQLHIHSQVGRSDQVEHLGQGRDRLPIGPALAKVVLAQLGQGQVGHGARPVAGAVDGFVVAGHDHAVSAELDVPLDTIGPVLTCHFEGCEGVLRRVMG